MPLEMNRDICIGAGNCVSTASEVFDQDDDGIVVLLADQPTEANLDATREAADYCPSGALHWRDR